MYVARIVPIHRVMNIFCISKWDSCDIFHADDFGGDAQKLVEMHMNLPEAQALSRHDSKRKRNRIFSKFTINEAKRLKADFGKLIL